MMNKRTMRSLALGAALAIPAVPAGADSLLAPLVIEDPGRNIRTFIQVKVEGVGSADTQWRIGPGAPWGSRLHYAWFRKGVTIDDLRRAPGPFASDACTHTNLSGTVSPWDMVFQPVSRGTPDRLPPDDQSRPGYSGTPFYGFMILDDEVWDPVRGGWRNVGFDPDHPERVIPGKEGNFSGFAYVVDFAANVVLDYKLLNNHRSARSGDFSVGFIAKKSIDFSWWPADIVDTEWLVLAVGPDMTTHADGSPLDNGRWAGSVTLTQAGDAIPEAVTGPSMGPGVFDNDENIISGDKKVDIVCMRLLDRAALLGGGQGGATRNGGWARKWVQPQPDELADPVLSPAAPTTANGAIVYKIEIGSAENGPGTWSAFMIETGGHVSPNGGSGGPHPNRPY